MAIVRTQAEVTLRRVEKEENRQAVREMIRAVDESSRTAGQLLDHAMVSFRTDDLARETIQLDDLIVDTVNRLHPISELRDVEIKTHKLTRTKILGDPILVQNAIQNVLDNAVKYTCADTNITIMLDQSDGYAHIRVQDEGRGFDDTEIDQLLKRFERGKNADGIVGSGLGLTIVDDIMRAHGGRIILMNNAGEGACVTLSFPL
jgi:two-component system sensor histidine kinase TctE